MTQSAISREDYTSAFHECPECGAGHCPSEVSARWWQRLLSCGDCDKRCTDDYALKDEVWLSRATKNERLHLECFEARLGRKLTRDDFGPAPINQQLMWAWERGRTSA